MAQPILSQSSSQAAPKHRPDNDFWRLISNDGSIGDLRLSNKMTINKIAALCNVADGEPATPLRPKIFMPTSTTDLKELLKTDKVCMVNQQFRPVSKPAEKQRITLGNLI